MCVLLIRLVFHTFHFSLNEPTTQIRKWEKARSNFLFCITSDSTTISSLCLFFLSVASLRRGTKISFNFRNHHPLRAFCIHFTIIMGVVFAEGFKLYYIFLFLHALLSFSTFYSSLTFLILFHFTILIVIHAWYMYAYLLYICVQYKKKQMSCSIGYKL